jgi:hypothetical protein
MVGDWLELDGAPLKPWCKEDRFEIRIILSVVLRTIENCFGGNFSGEPLTHGCVVELGRQSIG